jgi:sugar/nucleoside kinase (ribokinase family)
MPDVISFGILVADLVAYPVIEFPSWGKLVLADNITLSTGGGASNTATDMCKLGVDAGIVGRVGNDGLGEFIVNRLTETGLDTTGIKCDPHVGTSSCIVLTHPDGERCFVYSHGANSCLKTDDLDFSKLDKCKVLHVGSAMVLPQIDGQPAADFMKEIKKHGVLTVVDTAWDDSGKWLELVGPYLPYTDFFVPSIDEAIMLSGKNEPAEIAKFFMNAGAKTIVIKLGDKGSYLRSETEEIFALPFKVNPVDCTGAGDAFVAGFITALVKGWPLSKAIKFANAVGALATTGIGATTGVRDFETTIKFMETSST